MKVYLSGKITGDVNYKVKFAEKEKQLSELGYQVFNPALFPDMFTWDQFLDIDLKILSFCDAIYLMKGWESSKGANMEYREALRLGIKVIFDVGEENEKCA